MISRMRSKNKSLFQKLTEDFIWLDSKYTHPPYHTKLIKEIFSFVLNKKNRIVDIGCGAGGLSRKLAQMVTEGAVVGIDISEGYIKKLNGAKERDKSGKYKNLVFTLGSAEDIPYPDSYFNHAVCSESFGFWAEPEKGLTEVKRVLKPDGKLYIVNSYKGARVWVRISVKFFSLFSAYKEKLYSSQEYLGFFQRAGFAVVDQKKIMGTSLVTIGTKK